MPACVRCGCLRYAVPSKSLWWCRCTLRCAAVRWCVSLYVRWGVLLYVRWGFSLYIRCGVCRCAVQGVFGRCQRFDAWFPSSLRTTLPYLLWNVRRNASGPRTWSTRSARKGAAAGAPARARVGTAATRLAGRAPPRAAAPGLTPGALACPWALVSFALGVALSRRRSLRRKGRWRGRVLPWVCADINSGFACLVPKWRVVCVFFGDGIYECIPFACRTCVPGTSIVVLVFSFVAGLLVCSLF